MPHLLTPSKITAWLDCAHYLAFRNQIEGGVLADPGRTFGSLAELLVDKGVEHEAECLAEYRRQGRSILEVSPRDRGESFDAWVERVGNPLDEGYDVVYQMPFVHDGMRGIADFLVRVQNPETGEHSYEPVDAKLARSNATPGHVLQLCFYAEALKSLTGAAPRDLHLWMGSGRMESLLADQFLPYWRRLRAQLASTLTQAPAVEGLPEPCSHCEFLGMCTAAWRAEDSLVFVAGIRREERSALGASGVVSVAELATQEDPIPEIRAERLARIVNQAALQVEARRDPDGTPPYELVEPTDDPTWGQGFTLLPEPDDGDVFLDFEGHPFWRPDAELFFLFGMIARDDEGEWRFLARWAHDPDEEAEATAWLIDYLASRRAAHPGMHVYHYNHTERSALERLAAMHGVREVALSQLVDTGLFVDLLTVARNAMQVGTESYGLKHLERLTDYERGHELSAGADAVVEYEEYMKTGDTAILDRIAAYNEDDVRATRALRDWMVGRRPDIEWRAASLEPEEGHPELDEQVAALHAFGPDTPEHLLGDLLGYWVREWRAYIAPKLAQCDEETTRLLDADDVLAGLSCVGEVARVGKTGKPLKDPAMRFAVPEQAMAAFSTGAKVVYANPDGPLGYAGVDKLDAEAGVIDLLWNDRCAELGVIPPVVVLNDWVSPNPKPEALEELAVRVLDPANGAPNEVSLALLRRDRPAFTAGHGPPGGCFTDDLDEMRAWVCELDSSYVAIQGPPGTGKTFRGAHLVHSLVLAGKRVGITAMSHNAIDNLLDETIELFDERDDADLLRTVRRGSPPTSGEQAGVTYVGKPEQCAKDQFNLVAGTTWLFANKAMRDVPVDVLIVDEAGQLALADALAATRSAKNLVLLGDPLQLPQVSQAVHPGGGGLSVLEHVLCDHVTMPNDQGVFLTETRRMHPDVCSFISEEIYEGRLTSHESCAGQTTELGTGLRWMPIEHEGRATESEEEAEVVAAEIQRLLGKPWTNQHGVEAALEASDFMVVAPYNDQVQLIRERLDADALTRDVPVGTVDKFQGRQAAVVFFTMTTSSAEHMPRGADFLFSRNRLNVAISRARCIAYLVCTEDLLNSRARTVPDMRLISTLCAFVEYVEGVQSR